MEAQLKALTALQNIDLALEGIEKKKGTLPKQIAALEQDLGILERKKEEIKANIAGQESAIEGFQEEKKKAENLVQKYKEDQLSATADLDFDANNRAIALQELEMQLCQKNIKTAHQIIKEKKEDLAKVRSKIRTKKDQIKTYKEALGTIEGEVEEEEKKLQDARPKAVKKVSEDLYHTYENMRRHLVPPYVLTHVKDEACGGCFHLVPAQQQVTILEGKKMVQCEHCSRILTHVIIPEPPTKAKKGS